MVASVLAAYRQLLQDGAIAPDPDQLRAAEALERLEGDLNAQAEPHLSLPFRRKPQPPKGIYLHGPVGRGKSMLMDLFFDSAPVSRKRRVHFHAFMAEIHALIALWRRADAVERRARFGHARGDDPIAPTAGVIAEHARLLCFDEFHVVDIADAMILGRLFEALFARGVVIVATSNRAPEGLYENGLNRQLFLPFIDLIRERMDVVAVAGQRDFRLARLTGASVYFAPAGEVQARAFDALWSRLLAGAPEEASHVDVLGRTLVFPRALGGRVRVRFETLCGEALGPNDYLALAARFATVFLEDVPRMTPERRNEAARFVSLIDALYEARALVVVLAAAEPADLYPRGDGAFEFERTASRLEEMRSAGWVEAHVGSAPA